MIEARGIVVHYSGRVAVDGIDLSVAAGEWLGLIGPNGSGKTSLLGALAGTVPHEGVVRVGGRLSSELGRRQTARAVAVVPQHPVLPESMTVIDYVLLGRTPHLGYLAAETDADVAITEAALWDLGLIQLADRALGSLSGGERQRCVLARALAQESPILLLDEPTNALDIGHRQQVLDLVAGLRQTRSIAILAAMHDLTLAAQYADRLALMIEGKITAEGSAGQVLTESAIAAFSGARVSVIEGPDGEIVVVPRRGEGVRR